MLAFTPLACGLMGYQPSRWALGPTHTSRGRAAVSLSATPPSVLCVGECLFDALPSGVFLGGAPLNVACHLSQLGAKASFASAVGDDRLGREALRRLRARGVDVDLVATDAAAETGFVTAEVDEAGDATYTFATPAAWDSVPEDGLAAAAAAADAVVFGTNPNPNPNPKPNLSPNPEPTPKPNQVLWRSAVARRARRWRRRAVRHGSLSSTSTCARRMIAQSSSAPPSLAVCPCSRCVLPRPGDTPEILPLPPAPMAMPTLAIHLLSSYTYYGQLNDEELVPVADALLAHYSALPEAPADLIEP